MVYRVTGSKKIYIFAAVLGLSLFLFSMNNSGKALAYNPSDSNCGVDGTIHDYAGLVVGFGAQDDWSGGSAAPATGYGSVTVRVNTAYPSYQNQNNSNNPSGTGYYNLVNNSDGSLTNGSTFYVINKGDICGMGTSNMVILGNLNPTADVSRNEWQLDCDFSIRAASGGPQYNTSTKYQEFGIYPNGTPSGLRGGGYWTVDSGSFNANGDGESVNTGHIGFDNSQRIGPANGGTGSIVFIYHEPAPPTKKPPSSSGTVTCSSASESITSGTLGSHQRLHIFVYDSGHPLSVDSGDNATSTVLASGFIYSTGTRWSSGLYSPLGNTVTEHVVLETHYSPYGATDWTYSTYGSDQTTGSCYSAECSINSVTGDLPYGYIGGGTNNAHVSVTLYNDSPSGLGLPGNDGNASHVLNIEPTSGETFSNIRNPATGNPYAGPIAYPWTSDTSVTETFDTTISASGNLTAQVGYDGSSTITLVPPGSTCSYPVTVYQPPTPTVAVACQSSIYGSVSDPYYSTGGMTVNIYADGPVGSGTRVGSATVDTSGNYSLAMPSAYQDGQDHTFYAQAIDLYGVENGYSAITGMTGCESFHIAPGANGAKLMPSIEDPTSFGNTTPATDSSVTVTYGLTGTSYYGPNSLYLPSFPGVPDNPYYGYTKNGVPYGPSGGIPSPTGTGRFIDYSYLPPSAPVTSLQAGDVYCLVVGVTPSDGYIQNDGTVLTQTTSPNPDTQSSCDTVQNRPFFKVATGGIEAGGAFSNSGSCSTAGVIGGWNNSSTPLDYGAGSQLHALAIGPIVGFSSGDNSPTYLSFANTVNTTTSFTDGPSYSQSLGGDFGGKHCITTIGPGSGPGYTKYTSNTVIPGQTIAPGQNITDYVIGDAYISGNITYQNANSGAGWSAGTVPSFTLIATGNIYLDPGVTQLDGLYTSQPVGASPGGTLYTCGVENTATSYSTMTGTSLFNNCNNQLTVNGSFVARQVDLQRTFGSLRDETPTKITAAQLAPGEILSTPPAPRPVPQYLQECQTSTGLQYVTQGNPQCLPGDTYTGSYPPTVPGTGYNVPCVAKNGALFRYVYVAAGTTICPSGSSLTAGTLPIGPLNPPTSCSHQGIWTSTNTCAAEVVNFSPELYLSNPNIAPPSGGAIEYDAITSLPPVL